MVALVIANAGGKPTVGQVFLKIRPPGRQRPMSKSAETGVLLHHFSSASAADQAGMPAILVSSFVEPLLESRPEHPFGSLRWFDRPKPWQHCKIGVGWIDRCLRGVGRILRRSGGPKRAGARVALRSVVVRLASGRRGARENERPGGGQIARPGMRLLVQQGRKVSLAVASASQMEAALRQSRIPIRSPRCRTKLVALSVRRTAIGNIRAATS